MCFDSAGMVIGDMAVANLSLERITEAGGHLFIDLVAT
jgi:hypothetical protein